MISNLFKFILGFLLAMAILVGSGVATALYFMNRSALAPPKPVYANDNPQVKAQAPKTPDPNGTTPSPSPTPTPTPTPTTTEKANADATKPLPPGAFPARVTWSQGLSLRSEPKPESERVGGAGFNQKVIVLEESDDKVWKKIRIEGSNQEGWVKAGNLQQVDANDANQDNNQTDQTNQTR